MSMTVTPKDKTIAIIFHELSKYLARRIMSAGDAKLENEKCKRIQFMVGEWKNGERPNGGLCEEALAAEIEEALTDL